MEDNAGHNNSSSSSSSSPSGAQTVSDKDAVLSAVKLNYTWSTDEVIMTANFKIDNPTAHSFKDFEITCNHYAPSGTKIDSNVRTIYEVVPAHSKKSVRNFNMGFINSQAHQSACQITNLVLLN
jgi:hypothetical protein